MQLKSVVLPAPFGPIRPQMRPPGTSNEGPSSAVTPPKRTTSSSISSSDTPPSLCSISGPGVSQTRGSGGRTRTPSYPPPMSESAASRLVSRASSFVTKPSLRFSRVASLTAATYEPWVGYRAASVASSNGSCEPNRRQNPDPLLSPVFTAVGSACCERRIPPSALPCASLALVLGVVHSSRGAIGGAVPPSVQRSR